MAKCISPSAGHSSTNVLIVGAGWCWGNEGKGKRGGRERLRPWSTVLSLRCCWPSVRRDTEAGGLLRPDCPLHTGSTSAL